MKFFTSILFFLIFHSFYGQNIFDTVYTNTVTSTVLLDNQALPDVTISYTLMDTVNGIQSIIREALTDLNGQDIVDSLPVLKHITGLDAEQLEPQNDYSMLITNNGTGSNHLIRFRSDTKVAEEGFIVNMLGQKIEHVRVEYNPGTKTYDAIWKGESINKGNYLFFAKTDQGLVIAKIAHEKGLSTSTSTNKLPPELEGIGKTGAEITEDTAVSKYAINITHPGIEELIDTVWVQENTYHDFFFNTQGITYDDADIWGQINFIGGGSSPTDANVEYKRLLDPTAIFSTTAPNGIYNIQVPVVYETAHPGETEYIITFTPNGDPFFTEIDTVLVTPGANGFIHEVEEIPPNEIFQDIKGIVKHAYTKSLQSGITVRLIDQNTGTTLDEVTTDATGEYLFEDLSAGSDVEFELGADNYFWIVNSEYSVPENIQDTIITFNRLAYPDQVEVPVNGDNYTIAGTGEEAAEMVGADKINFEEILRDADMIYASAPGTGYWIARTWIEDNFYEGTSPLVTVNTPRDITSIMINNYEPYTNYYSGQLGWNVDFGNGNTTLTTTATTNYGVYAILGGEMDITGQIQEYAKELQGRRMNLGTVNSRTSFMNATPTVPDDKDRAYVKLILINQNARFDTEEETYSLRFATSNIDDYKSVENYYQIPGEKLHCKQYNFREK